MSTSRHKAGIIELLYKKKQPYPDDGPDSPVLCTSPIDLDHEKRETCET